MIRSLASLTLVLLTSITQANPAPAPSVVGVRVGVGVGDLNPSQPPSTPTQLSHPLFTPRATRRAAFRPTFSTTLATTLDASVTLTSLAAGVLLADGLIDVGLALHDLRSRTASGPDTSESAQVLTLRASLDWPLDAAHALTLPIHIQLGAGPDQASYLGADAGLAIHAGRLAFAASLGLARTSLHVIDDPVPLAAITLSWGAP